MGWLRQHDEAGHVRGVARVAAEPEGYSVRLTEGDAASFRSHEGGYHYATRDLAFAAADVLVRHRLGGHECTAVCSGWVEDADVR